MECQEIALGDREALTINYWFPFSSKMLFEGFFFFFGGFFYIYFFDKVANSTKKITEWIS